MATKKTKRTQAKDISYEEKELTLAEAGRIKGGGVVLQGADKSKILPPPNTTSTTIAPETTAKTGYDLKQNKIV